MPYLVSRRELRALMVALTPVSAPSRVARLPWKVAMLRELAELYIPEFFNVLPMANCLGL